MLDAAIDEALDEAHDRAVRRGLDEGALAAFMREVYQIAAETRAHTLAAMRAIVDEDHTTTRH
jgi:hypothetical protein